MRTRSRRGERQPLPKGFGTIWSTVAIDLIGFGIVLPILPQYAERFGASPATIGLLVASFSVAQLIGAPLWGRLSDRIGRKPVLVVSLFGTAAGSLLTGAAGGIAVLFLGRIIDGASGASVSVAQASVSDVAAPRDRARLMGLLGAAFGLGFVAGPAIGAIGALVGPRVPFYIAAVVALVNGVVAIRRLPETAHVRASGPALATDAVANTSESAAASGKAATAEAEATTADAARAEREAAFERAGTLDGPQPGTPFDEGAAGPNAAAMGAPPQRRAILSLIAVSFVGLVAFSGFEATFSLLTAARFQLHLSGTGAVFTMIGLALVAVQVGLVGRVNDRLGESRTLRSGLAANAAGLALLAVDGGWATLVPALVLLVIGQGLITPTLSSAVAGRAGEQRGVWLGWQQSAGGLARVIGPVTAGVVFQHVGIGAPYVVGAVLALLALALVPS